MELTDITYTGTHIGGGYISTKEEFLKRAKQHITQAKYIAETLHGGVVFGGGLVMTDQIERTAQIVSENKDLDPVSISVATIATYLHKSFEPKRIRPDRNPLTNEEIKAHFGPYIAYIVNALSTEPEDESKNKHDQWVEKAQWSTKLPIEAQLILLAEKKVNYEVSRDRPNMKKTLDWHKEYYETRSLMVDALATRFPELAKEVNAVKDQGMAVINKKIEEKKRQDALAMQSKTNGGMSL